jgi:hypothetical protein
MRGNPATRKGGGIFFIPIPTPVSIIVRYQTKYFILQLWGTGKNFFSDSKDFSLLYQKFLRYSLPHETTIQTPHRKTSETRLSGL